EIDSIIANDRVSLIRLWTEPAVRTYLGGVLTRDAAEARAGQVIADAANSWAIRNRVNHDERMLGLITLGTHCDLNELEISYLLLPEFRGRGYASVAVARTCELAFTTRNALRVVAETQTANIASIRLLERLGFERLYDCERFGQKQSVYALVAPNEGCR
ncbi:MAG: GNAT family N-acetyltransferase, partial [Casimicrobium sp.]